MADTQSTSAQPSNQPSARPLKDLRIALAVIRALYLTTAIMLVPAVLISYFSGPNVPTVVVNYVFLTLFVLALGAAVWSVRKNFRQLAMFAACTAASMCLLGWLLLPQVGGGPASPRNSCQNNMKQIGLALLNYETAHGELPPLHTTEQDGKAVHSWRALILPFMEESQLYSLIDLKNPWDRQSRIVAGADIPGYHCPAEKDCPLGSTSYLAVVGPDTAWRPGQGLKLSDIKDPANTILLVEMKNSGIHWAEPRDLDLEHLPPGITKQSLFQSLSNHPGGFNALFADGHVEFIPSTIPWSDFEASISINADKKLDRDKW